MPAKRTVVPALSFLFVLGAGVALLGDACHVASGTTAYAASRWPVIWRSPVWFPILVGCCVVAVASIGRRLGLPSRLRTRTHVAIAVPAVLAVYAFTATLRQQEPTVGVVLVAALATVVWCAWDASLACLGIAAACAVIGPATEIGFVAAGVYRYAPESNQLYGVAPWLPCLYFALGAVTSGVLRALADHA